MAEVIENLELNKFYTSLRMDVISAVEAEEDGGIQEFKFTEIVLMMLADAGETENAVQCHDIKLNKAGQVQHKVSGYALSENGETLDLFITVYKDTEQPEKVYKDAVTSAVNQATRFLKNSINKYFEEIEESSQVFELAHRISKIEMELIRVNIFVLTNGIATSDPDAEGNLKEILINYHIRDIEYLYRLNSSKTKRIAIEIDFENNFGGAVPCISMPSENQEYESYLAIISGETLSGIYQNYGSRLLEQNVRSFLQFSGKINQGMRETIMTKAHMFLAYNNGIAATAESVELIDFKEGGKAIKAVKDLQIVNGGQTTASIFHTKRKDKADVSKVYVQMKLSVIKDTERIGDIVSKIAEYANTQNRVKPADLTSNNPFHIEMEKLSRNIWAPPIAGQNQQTRWFYERARGQYKDAINKEVTPARQKQFEIKNPKKQMFAKEDLAKFYNSWELLPNQVAVGREKCYSAFMGNLKKDMKPDNIFFEDVVAKAIIFKTAELEYGVGANSIATKDNIRSFVVPYSLSWLNLMTENKIDLLKIWKNQSLSNELTKLIKNILAHVDKWLNESSALRNVRLSDWVRKEECWIDLKKKNFDVDLITIKGDFIDPKQSQKRYKQTDDDIAKIELVQKLEKLNSVPTAIWGQIEEWGRSSKMLTTYQGDIIFNIRQRLRNNKELSLNEVNHGSIILDFTIENAPELFYNMDEISKEVEFKKRNKREVTIEIIKRVVSWDKKNRKLKPFEFEFMAHLADGKKTFSDYHKTIALKNIEKVEKFGFKI